MGVHEIFVRGGEGKGSLRLGSVGRIREWGADWGGTKAVCFVLGMGSGELINKRGDIDRKATSEQRAA